MKKLLLILPAVALIAAGCNSSPTNTNTTPPPAASTNTMDDSMDMDSDTSGITTPNPSPAPAATPPAAAPGKTVEVTVIGKNFGFEPGTIKVKKGDKVKIIFQNQTGTHDWVVDEFTGARTKIIQGGQTDTITFVADKAGTFEYYCSVGSHRQMGMKGSLIVE